MGAYNEVRARLPCPACDQNVECDVQFKYGSVVHYRYAIGSALIWGANDVGIRGAALVAADGEAGPCPNCAWDGDWPACLTIEDDVIRAVHAGNGGLDFVSRNEPFIVLRPS